MPWSAPHDPRPNNSDQAIVHLAKATNATHIVAHPMYESVVSSATQILASQSIHVKTVPQPDVLKYGSESNELISEWNYPMAFSEERRD